MKKKAQEESELARNILFVVVVLFLIVIFVSYFLIVNRAKTTELCRSSVETQALVKDFKLSNTGAHTDLNCKTYTVEFFEDHAEKYYMEDGKKKGNFNYPVYVPGKSKTTDYKSLNSDVVNYVVAQETELCWYNFLEGKKKIFLDDAWNLHVTSFGLDWGDDDDACFICSQIKFDVEDVKQEEFTGFWKFIKAVERRDPLTDKIIEGETYHDYLINSKRVCDTYDDLLNDDHEIIGRPIEDWYNPHYGWNLNPAMIYASIDELPDDACWNFFVDGVSNSLDEVNGKMIPKDFDASHSDSVVRDINFTKDRTYSVVLVRRGQDNDMTFFTYVVPSSSLNDLCEAVVV